MDTNTEGILTNEQVDQIVDTLKKEKIDMPEFNEEPIEVFSDEVDVLVNPNDGSYLITDTPSLNISGETITDIIANDSCNDSEYEKEYLEKILDNEADALQMFNVITRYRNGEKFSVYNALPNIIKDMVKNTAGTTNIQTLQTVANAVLDDFISNMESEQALVDINEALHKEIEDSFNDISDLYSKLLSDKVDKLNRIISELEEKGENEQAKIFKDLLLAFEDSYNMNRQFDALKSMSGIRKSLRRVLKRPRVLEDSIKSFNYKYSIRKNKKLVINDVTNVPMILLRNLNNYSKDRSFTLDEANQFTLLFTELSKNLSPNNPVEHQYMYYTIQNIMALDAVDINKSEFNRILLDNIIKVIDEIHGLCE